MTAATAIRFTGSFSERKAWGQLAEVASRLGEPSDALVIFAAATGLRAGEWIALERRDIDRDASIVYVRRAFRNGRLKCTKTEGSVRAVPLHRRSATAMRLASAAPTAVPGRFGAERISAFRS